MTTETDIGRRRARFQEALARYVRELGHNAVTPGNIASLRIDDDYTPYLGARRLHALDSASDQSRLIAAYSLALADVSRTLGDCTQALLCSMNRYNRIPMRNIENFCFHRSLVIACGEQNVLLLRIEKSWNAPHRVVFRSYDASLAALPLASIPLMCNSCDGRLFRRRR